MTNTFNHFGSNALSTEKTDTHKSLLLVGGGSWGKNLARNFHDIGALHTICDTNESLLNTYKNQYSDILTTSNYTTALQDPAITQVAIAAPAALHYTLAEQALKAGKDVYVEKPLCLNSFEGEILVALAEQNNAILMVGHLLQYHPCVQRLQELVAAGELGKLQYIVSNRLNLGSIRTEENILWSFSPHDISVILSLCGNNNLPETVSCIGGAYLSKQIADISVVTMHFNDNIKAHIHASWLHPYKEQKMIVIGSSGMIVFDDLLPWPEKLAFYREPIVWSADNTPQTNKCPPEFINVPQCEPLKIECQHFISCCQMRQNPKTDGQEGLRVLKVLQAAQSSLSNEGQSMTIATSSKAYFNHSSAIIDPGAFISEGSKIWHFSHIMDNARLGPHCNIGQNVVISPGVTLGRNVKVQNNVSIYTGVTCEDNVFLGPGMVFTNVNNPRSEVNQRNNYQTTIVRQGATIGANATIICGIELGEYCFIGAGAVVTIDVKPYALVVGNPSRQIGWMSRSGQRLDLPLKILEMETRMAACPSSGESYILTGNNLALLKYEGSKL